MSELAYISNLDPKTLSSVSYNDTDLSIIEQQNIDTVFDPDTDYIEFFIYDFNKKLLYSTLDYRNYTIQTQTDSVSGIAYNTINVDPSIDSELFGIDRGKFFTKYNFFRKRLASNPNDVYYISEISSDRTEIRLNSTVIQANDVINSTNEFINYITNATYYPEFYFNNGDQLLTIINIALVDDNPLLPSVLLKLYEPLPTNLDIKSKGWIVEKVSEPVAYGVEYPVTPITASNIGVQLGGPNFNINVQDQIGNSTNQQSYNTIINSPLTGSNSQINSLFQEQAIDINVDYSDYSNFVNFSSAVYRLENFYYKLTQIQSSSIQLSASVNIITGSTSASYAISQSRVSLQNYINDTITNFDEYEYYLYFTSGSKAWPKTNSTPPFIQAGTGSAAGLAFLNAQTVTASNYDIQNPNNLFYAIPEYLRNDPSNQPFEEFVGMIGNHFDNLWVYYKDVTNKYNADNRIDYGISKDLVADVLKDFGLKIYQNNFSSDDVYLAFLGLTSSGSTFPVANITSSLPVPNGSFIEYISSSISASNSIIPLNDLNKRIYKRLYHNLPYLLKKKGTEAGLRTLINTYGIPDTILRINEFGGKNRNENQDWDNYQDQFNYSWRPGNSTWFFSSSWASFNSPSSDPPYTMMFRFKTSGSVPVAYSQSFMNFDSNPNVGLYLEYSGSGLTSASYSGSIPSASYQYGNLKLINSNGASSSISLPFFNEDWWSIMVTYNPNTLGTQVFAKQKGTYIGDNYIKYQGSSSDLGLVFPSVNTSNIFHFPPSGSKTVFGKTYNNFRDYLQELRFYSTTVSESVFNDFVLNPYSIEGNQITGSQSSHQSLLFRAPLGTDLKTFTTLNSPSPSTNTVTLEVKTNNETNPLQVTSNWTSNFDTTTFISPPNYDITVFSGSSFGPFYSASIIIDTDTIIEDNVSGYNSNIGFTFTPYYNSTTVLPSYGVSSIGTSYQVKFYAFYSSSDETNPAQWIVKIKGVDNTNYGTSETSQPSLVANAINPETAQEITLNGNIFSHSTLPNSEIYFEIEQTDGSPTYIIASGSVQNISPLQGIYYKFQQILTTEFNSYYTGSSIHPAVTGSFTTQSWTEGNSNYRLERNYPSSTNLSLTNVNQEYIYQDQPNIGIKIQTNNKIQLAPSSSYGQVLSKYRTIQQDYPISQSYTEDINYVEVGFSPQDEINDDIQEQFGFFNIGDYIGDPRQISSSNTFYPDLNNLRDNYFQKYYQNNNIWDYIRIIKYFDNSLFKLIQDFIPARAGVATGVIIKPHILERSKYPVPQFTLTSSLAYVGSGSDNIVSNFTDVTITGSIGSITTLDTASGLNFITQSEWYESNPLYTFSSSNGGVMPDLYGATASSGYFVNITQSYNGINDTIAGLVSYTDVSQQEFYNGELSGSTLVVTTQSLNPECDIYLSANDVPTPYVFSFYNSGITNFEAFSDTRTINNGEIYLYYDTGSTLGGDSIGPGGLPSTE
jgi:hypothetical protein